MTKTSSARLGAVLLACFLLFGATSSFAQSLGEAARRERARKQKEPRRATHVYTEEELARPQILYPGDRARAEAARGKPTSAAAEQAVTVPGAVPKPAEIPLGDVARHYRLLKQLRENQELGEAPALIGPAPLAAPVFAKPPAAPAPAAPVPAAPAPTAPAAERKLQSIEQPRPAKPREHGVVRKVRVQRGDSLWKLAKQHLGHGTDWPELAAANPQIIEPARIFAGDWIQLPEGLSRLSPRNSLRVRKGDSLWKLARSHFGRGQAWSCLAQANPQIQNVDLIYPGQILAIPEGCAESSAPKPMTAANTDPPRTRD